MIPFSRNEKIAYEKGYRVIGSDVVSHKGKILKLKPIKSYPRFNIKNGIKKLDVIVHRLVAYQKFGDLIYSTNDGDVCIRHLDGDKSNFCESNIDIGSRKENTNDRPKDEILAHCLKISSDRRLFVDDDIIRIRFMRDAGESLKVISELFCVSISSISDIVNRKTYKDIV